MKVSKRVRNLWSHKDAKGSFIANYIVLRGKKKARRFQLESRVGGATFKYKSAEEAKSKGWKVKAVK